MVLESLCDDVFQMDEMVKTYGDLTILKGKYAGWKGVPRPQRKSANQLILFMGFGMGFIYIVFGHYFQLIKSQNIWAPPL